MLLHEAAATSTPALTCATLRTFGNGACAGVPSSTEPLSSLFVAPRSVLSGTSLELLATITLPPGTAAPVVEYDRGRRPG